MYPRGGHRRPRRGLGRLVLTACLAAVTLGSAAVAVTLGRPDPPPVLPFEPATAWLVSTVPRAVERANALVGAPTVLAGETAAVQIGAGHAYRIVRTPARTAVVDQQTQMVTVIDERTLRTTSGEIPVGSSIETDGTTFYRLDPLPGRVSRLDARTLHTVPGPLPGGRTISASATAGGALWLARRGGGALTRIRGGSLQAVRALPLGGDLLLAGNGRWLLVVDRTTGRVALLRDGRVRTRLTSPSLRGARLGNLAISPDGQWAAATPPSDPARLLLVRLTGRGAAFIVTVGAPAGSRLGLPVPSGGRVYVASGGTVYVIRTADPPVIEANLPVAMGPGRVEVFRTGGILWANYPDGPFAVAVYDGVARRILKYPQVGSAVERSPTYVPRSHAPTVTAASSSAPSPVAQARSTPARPSPAPPPPPPMPPTPAIGEPDQTEPPATNDESAPETEPADGQ